MQNVYEQYGKPLRLGFVDPATGVDEYIKLMEAAGLQTVIDAYTAQAAAYIASNK
jgi:putative aldouronate transport system substrate-binding protein